ncbi:MAG: hypothetical protein AAF960_26855 [Bacteroidota bacterium]
MNVAIFQHVSQTKTNNLLLATLILPIASLLATNLISPINLISLISPVHKES